MKVGAVILAAGRGSRFGSDKVRARLGGKPVWRWSLDTFASHPLVSQVVLVCSPENLSYFQEQVDQGVHIVEGGETRQDSCRAGCLALGDAGIVLVQDAARPFTSAELISNVIAATERSGASAPTVPVVDTLRTLTGEMVDRSKFVAMQTPQGALLTDLLDAHRQVTDQLTDDVALMERIGFKPEFVSGDPANFKITTEDDLARARAVVGYRETRTGFGYDIHRFSDDPSRPLMIGGVQFDGMGLEGHSDADALLHAIVDACLGAAGLGDIGVHFPNDDQRWKDRASVYFLSEAATLLRQEGWQIVNIDASVVSEAPKIMPKADQMRHAIAAAIGCEARRISLKATTNERLGAIGRSEGLAAFAVATITEA